MDVKKSNGCAASDIEQAYQMYGQFKREIDAWQRERGSYWLLRLNLAKESPYLPIVDLPQDAVVELWQRLNASAEVEINSSALLQAWEQLKQGRNNMDAGMAARLKMAVGGITKLAARMVDEKGIPEKRHNPRASENPEKNITACPVCGELSNLAVLTAPDGKRVLHCTTCSFEWPVQRTGCLYCGNEDSKQITYLDNDGFAGVEMVICQNCGQYCKEIDARKLITRDYVWEDLKTIPLNYAAEQWIEEQVKRNEQMN